MTLPQTLVSTETPGAQRYSLVVARGSDDVVAAQRLRYRIFAGELGATLHGPLPGLDVDEFDEHCDHLLVREDRGGEIVGCYRMLPPGRAGGLYSEREFDLSAFAPLRAALVETGRSCVHPEHRTGAVMSLMWAGIARYMTLTGHRYLAGCASVPLADGGSLARGVWDVVSAKHLSPPTYRVRPLLPWDPDAVPSPPKPVLPPLLRGYLRLGAWACGRPALDPDFGCADLLVLLPMDRVDRRYLRFLLGA
jgi:putative hemolysin